MTVRRPSKTLSVGSGGMDAPPEDQNRALRPKLGVSVEDAGAGGLRMTFAQAADAVLEDLRANWMTSSPWVQWRRATEVYAAAFRHKLLEDVTIDDVAAALAPLWSTRPAAAAKVRTVWERVLAHPAGGYGPGGKRGNPAAWSPSLRALLRPDRKDRRVPAAINDLPLMLERLRSGRGLGRQALELSVLTCIPLSDICRLRGGGLRLEPEGWTIVAEHQAEPGSMRRSWRTAALIGPAAARLEALRVATGSADEPLFRLPGRVQPLTAKNLSMLSQRLFGPAAERLAPRAVEAAFRIWAQTREDVASPHLGRQPSLEAALAVRTAPTDEAGWRPIVNVQERDLFLGWQTFLGAASP